jgi:hypothetical protein
MSGHCVWLLFVTDSLCMAIQGAQTPKYYSKIGKMFLDVFFYGEFTNCR